jgi:hypothetical protein
VVVGTDTLVAPLSAYHLVIRSQAGAEDLLRGLGALREIERAVVGHCEATGPRPTYAPQEIKRWLRPHGWQPERRVPAYSTDWDHLRINERYDLYKDFGSDGRPAGVAIEIERWEIQNDLLKLRRGLRRGLIVAGVLLHDGPANLEYCFDHVRHVSEPLFGDIPVLFCAPEGPGLT